MLCKYFRWNGFVCCSHTNESTFRAVNAFRGMKNYFFHFKRCMETENSFSATVFFAFQQLQITFDRVLWCETFSSSSCLWLHVRSKHMEWTFLWILLNRKEVLTWWGLWRVIGVIFLRFSIYCWQMLVVTRFGYAAGGCEGIFDEFMRPFLGKLFRVFWLDWNFGVLRSFLSQHEMGNWWAFQKLLSFQTHHSSIAIQSTVHWFTHRHVYSRCLSVFHATLESFTWMFVLQVYFPFHLSLFDFEALENHQSFLKLYSVDQRAKYAHSQPRPTVYHDSFQKIPTQQ